MITTTKVQGDIMEKIEMAILESEEPFKIKETDGVYYLNKIAIATTKDATKDEMTLIASTYLLEVE